MFSVKPPAKTTQVTPVVNTSTELNHIMDRDVGLLSGGELQRFAIGTVCVQQADVYVSLPRTDAPYRD